LKAQPLLSANYINEKSKPNKEYRLGKTKLFNQIYMESGVKSSNQTDTIGNLTSSLFGLQHQLNRKLQLFHAYNYISQNVWWGNIAQHNYYANFEYKKSRLIKFNGVFSFLNSNTKIFQELPPPPAFPPIQTSPRTAEYISSNNVFLLVSSTYNWKHFFIKPSFAISQLNNLKDKQTQIQTGAELIFDVNNNEAFILGLGVYHFINNQLLSTLIKPSISFIINDELSFTADYFYSNARNFSDQDGYIIYNSVDKTYDRLNFILKYEFANNLFLYSIYQKEQKQDYKTNNNYSFNSFFLGIKYNL
jgi:hypothetical protein